MGARPQIPDRRPGRAGLTAAERARAEGHRYMTASMPRSAAIHLFADGDRRHLFLADGSRLFGIDADSFGALDIATERGHAEEAIATLGLAGPPAIEDAPPAVPRVHALSLAVAQKCNLGCVYCYAQQGAFGGAAKAMPLPMAERAVELLLSEAATGSGRANLAFLGGEPLVNRTVLQETTRRAAELARHRGIALSFSITTNGTLLNAADAEFFETYGFAVTVSLDGPGPVHDRLRPFKGGRGSFDTIMRNLRPLLAQQRRMQVSARVTVTPDNLALRSTLDGLIAERFHSVGFSPMLSAPGGQGEMQSDHLAAMLGEMIDCGREFERQVVGGARYPFANIINALREIHRGTHRPYPCGAGAGYFGVSADGELAACHRFVGDAEGAMGSVDAGVDRVRQAHWLVERHVHRQEPCRACWARYLCGGGCHHEVIRRGRPACDYIRGWLHYCIEAYLRVSQAQPAAFGR